METEEEIFILKARGRYIGCRRTGKYKLHTIDILKTNSSKNGAVFYSLLSYPKSRFKNTKTEHCKLRIHIPLTLQSSNFKK
jgi:hypothetical protein